jgi:hypothetical protein
MADDQGAANAVQVANEHLAYIRSQTNDKNQIADAQRGVDAAMARHTAINGAAAPTGVGALTSLFSGALGKAVKAGAK